MARPVLWWNITFQPGVVNKLSFVEPYNRCNVIFSCDKAYEHFMCRVTKEGEPWGIDEGILVYENENKQAGVQSTFIIDSLLHLLNGEGEYRIGMYVKDTEGYWNLGQFFMVKISGTSNYQKVLTDDNKHIVVKEA